MTQAFNVHLKIRKRPAMNEKTTQFFKIAYICLQQMLDEQLESFQLAILII